MIDIFLHSTPHTPNVLKSFFSPKYDIYVVIVLGEISFNLKEASLPPSTLVHIEWNTMPM